MLQGELLSNASGHETELTSSFHQADEYTTGRRSTGTASTLARAFPVWNRSTDPYNWCHKRDGTKSGILFVKVQKCASSTGSGVTGRIADTLGRRILNSTGDNHTSTTDPKVRNTCFAKYFHGIASHPNQNYESRQADRSMLWTIIRHPASRVISEFFFLRVSRDKWNATQDSILKYVAKPRDKKFILDYLKLREFDTREEEIAHVIQNYDFIALSERMAESLVVMGMLLKIPLADLIVLSSKAGEYDDASTPQGCVKLTRAWTTQTIDAYLAGDFLKDNYDMILYQAVNASLDLTIDALGRDRVVAGIASYHTLSAKNGRECKQKAIFPCPRTLPNHTTLSKRDCYFQDSGCGHACTDIALLAESDEEWNTFQMPVL